MRKTRSLIVMALLATCLIASPSQASRPKKPPPSGSLLFTPPFTTADQYADCRHPSDTSPLKTAYCSSSTEANPTTGELRTAIELRTTSNGELPALLASHDAFARNLLIVRGRLSEPRAVLPVTIKLQVDRAHADFEGTIELGSRSPRASTVLMTNFASWPCGCAYGWSQDLLVDDRPSTPQGNEFFGPLTITYEVQNVPAGDFEVQIETQSIGELLRYNRGITKVELDAGVLSVQVG